MNEGRDSTAEAAAAVVSVEWRRRLAQLMMFGFNGAAPDDAAWRLLEEAPPSAIILFKQNISSQDQLSETLTEIQRRCGGGLLIGIDQEGGRVVRLTQEVGFPTFPSAHSLADGPNPTQAVRQAANITGRGLRELGINLNFAPVLDVATDAENRVIGDRSYSSNPEVVARLGLEVIGALQAAGVAATAKHFPGHGPTSVDSHLDLPRIDASREDMERIHLPPFHRAIRSGVASVMTAHAVYTALDPDVPATLSHRIITGILREDWGFNGVVMTDSLTMQAIARRWTVPEACVMAFEAGVDMLMVPASPALQRQCVDALCGALSTGRITAERVDTSLQRIAHLRATYAASPTSPVAKRLG